MRHLFRFIQFALCVTLLFPACRPDQDTIDEETKPRFLLELLRADDHLNTFAAAIDQAGLASMLEGAGIYTVFAPTDEAFAAYLQAQGIGKLEDLPKEHLRNLVLNHFIKGEYRLAKLPEGYLTTQAELTLAGDRFAVSLLLARRNNVLHINDARMTIHADQEGINGIIHEVDRVLALPNVANHMLNNAEFQSLLAALKISSIGNEYIARLTNGGPYTVLAPTNIAFATLFVELRVNSLAQIPVAQLDHMLRNLYFDGNVRMDEFSAGQVLKATNGTTVKVEKSATGLMFVDERGRQARITIGDVQGTNGVIHAVDKVVLDK